MSSELLLALWYLLYRANKTRWETQMSLCLQKAEMILHVWLLYLGQATTYISLFKFSAPTSHWEHCSTPGKTHHETAVLKYKHLKNIWTSFKQSQKPTDHHKDRFIWTNVAQVLVLPLQDLPLVFFVDKDLGWCPKGCTFEFCKDWSQVTHLRNQQKVSL